MITIFFKTLSHPLHHPPIVTIYGFLDSVCQIVKLYLLSN